MQRRIYPDPYRSDAFEHQNTFTPFIPLILQQQLALARAIRDRRGEANALGNLGLAYYALGNARQAIKFYQKHLTLARATSDRRGEANALSNLGLAYAALGDAHQAIDFYQQTLALAPAMLARSRWRRKAGYTGTWPAFPGPTASSSWIRESSTAAWR